VAHEIESTDGVVLTGTRAWHGLGTIVEQAPTPHDALGIIGADYEIESWPVYATDGESRRTILESHRANVRKDTGAVLGVVGKDYKIVQNRELADFAACLADVGETVVCETAGTLRGGTKIWFLLRGESFTTRGGDVQQPYVALANGHDGLSSFTGCPTNIRVVCANTMRMMLSQQASQRSGFNIRHTGNMAAKKDAAREIIKRYSEAVQATRVVIDQLAAKEVNSDQVKAFFLEAYVRDFGAIPAKTTNAAEERSREKAITAWRAYDRRFQTESVPYGSTAWIAANAYTGWLQNDRKLRTKSATVRAEQRQGLKLFGDDINRADRAMLQALAV
jgi:phage/plasmid-like protein (TIGR03299 family)